MDLARRSGGAEEFFDDEDAAALREDFVVRDVGLGGTQFRCGWEAEVSGKEKYALD
jgi:hypothetical protein